MVKLEKVPENHRPLLAFTHADPSAQGSFQSLPSLGKLPLTLHRAYSHFPRLQCHTIMVPSQQLGPTLRGTLFLLLPFLSHEGQPFINKLHLNTFWASVCLAQPAGCQPPRAGPTSGHLSRTCMGPGTEHVPGKWLMGLVNDQRALLGVGKKKACLLPGQPV